jgi:hypothetical protein
MTKRGEKARTKWRKLISEQARSGQTVTAFCRERGLCRPYFFAWKKRLREDTAPEFECSGRAEPIGFDAYQLVSSYPPGRRADQDA